MSEEVRVIIADGVVVICVGLFIGSYILNRRTPKPEGCENLGSECEGCQMTSCSHYVEKNNEKKEG